MKKWEYLIFDSKNNIVRLDEFGKEHWELVNVIGEYEGYKIYYFKRELLRSRKPAKPAKH